MKTNTPEGIQDRIACLFEEHASLERELVHLTDEVRSSEIKRQKLRIKDEIARLEQKLAEEQPPGAAEECQTTTEAQADVVEPTEFESPAPLAAAA